MDKITKKAQQMPKWLKNTLIVVIGIITAGLLAVALTVFFNAQKLGEETSLFMANGLATAVGSIEGAAEAMAQTGEAFEEGKAEGLSARDTTVRLIENILTDGEQRLEVYLAGFSMTNKSEAADTYAALYVLKATAIFSVDMSKIKVSSNNGKITVVLPPIDCKIDINNNETQKLAEYSKKFFDGATSDGYEAFTNSMEMLENKTEEAFKQNPHLKENAEKAAQKAVERLVKSVCANKYDYEIKCSGVTAREGE